MFKRFLFVVIGECVKRYDENVGCNGVVWMYRLVINKNRSRSNGIMIIYGELVNFYEMFKRLWLFKIDLILDNFYVY